MKIPFGMLPSGQLVDISTVERGLKCGCLCPGCRSPLVARQGEINIHHFAHYAVPACQEGLEVAITMGLLQTLNEVKQIHLPPLAFRGKLIRDGHLLGFDEAREEPELAEGLKPTLGIVFKGRDLGIVLQYDRLAPIIVSKLVEAKQPALLINLASLIRSYKNQESELSLATLHDIVANVHASKSWIYNSHLTPLIEAERQAQIAQAAAWQKQQAEVTRQVQEELRRKAREKADRLKAEQPPSRPWPPLHETFIRVSIEQLGGLELSFPTSLVIAMLLKAYGPNAENPPVPEIWLQPFSATDRPLMRALMQKLGIIRHRR